MFWLILALVLCVALASAVLGMVAVPARRQGRAVLTERGEKVARSVSSTTDRVTTKAKDATKGAAESVSGAVKRERADAS